MRTTLASLLAAAVTVAALAAQSGAPSSISNERSTAWQQFQSQYGRFTAEWNTATGTPSGIWGDGVDLGIGRITDLEVARAQAQALLARQAGLLGTGSSTWVESIANFTSPLHTLVYDQYYQGLKVIGGRADVRIHECGGVSYFGASAFPIPANLVLQPVVQSNEAILLAYASQNLKANLGPVLAPIAKTKLVLWGDSAAQTVAPAKLAWEVSVDELDQKIVGRAYIDAVSGAVLQYVNDLHYCNFGDAHVSGDHAEAAAELAAQPRTEVNFGEPTGLTNVTGNIKAWYNTTIDPLLAITNQPLAGIKVTFGAASAFTDKDGNFTIINAGTTAGTLSASWVGAKHYSTIAPKQAGGIPWSFSTTATPGTPVNIQIFTSATPAATFAESNCAYLVHKINEYCRGLISGFSATADVLTVNVNVAGTCNAFMSGTTINFYPAGGGCVNTAYSTVVEHEWGHHLDNVYGGISQTEGLSEGWGDILALYSTGQPVLGKNFGTSYPYIRIGTNTTTRGSCTEVHCAGESWMGWAWDIRVALIAKLGAVAGAARAEQIVVPTITANAANQTNAVLQVFLRDDNDANLNNGTPNCEVLGAACTKRNIPNPSLGCVGATAAVFTPFGVACAGTTGTPTLSATGRPVINTSFSVNLASARPSFPAALYAGSSTSVFGSYTLPLNLGFIGMTDCFLYTNVLVNIPASVSVSGTATLPVTVPNNAALLGGNVYFQWAIVDPGANLLGVVHSQAGQAHIGNN